MHHNPCILHDSKDVSILSFKCRCHIRKSSSALKDDIVKDTLKSKVNDWAIKVLLPKITFEYLRGIENTLLVTISSE